MPRVPAPRALALALLLIACGEPKDGSTGASTGGTLDATTGTGSSGTSGSTSDTTCAGNCPTSTTGSPTSSGTGTASGTGTTAGGMIPPACSATSDCPQGQHCLKKSCDDVDDEPGCDEYRCYTECSSPFDRTGFWTCADTQACCGGYPCEAGLCTEHFDPSEGG